VGDNVPAHGAVTLIACQGASIAGVSTSTGTPAPVGGDSGSP
jgi:hypothetical protein